MKRLAVSICLCILACDRPPPAPAVETVVVVPPLAAPRPPPGLEDLFWSTWAQDGKILLAARQTATSRNDCRVEVVRETTTLWASAGCIADRGQLRFLSPDGQLLLVLTRQPDVDGPVGSVPIGSIYRRGKLVRRLRFADLLVNSRGFSIDAGKLRWLRDDTATDGPGGVQLTFLDGRTLLLPFQAAQPAAPAPARRASVEPLVLDGPNTAARR